MVMKLCRNCSDNAKMSWEVNDCKSPETRQCYRHGTASLSCSEKTKLINTLILEF